LCDHVKADGNLCKSPALNDNDYCFFHQASRERTKRQRRAARLKLPFQLPLLEDAQSIQIAIGDVLNALLAGQIDHKTAGLLLYGLQTAATNVRHAQFYISAESRRYTVYTNHEEETLEREIEQEVAEEEAKLTAAAPKEVAKDQPAGSSLPPKKSAAAVPHEELRQAAGAQAPPLSGKGFTKRNE
jgi:hypothetical protein